MTHARSRPKALHDSSGTQEAPSNLLLSFIGGPLAHLPILFALVIACFGRTLTSYFLADDIGEVRYVHEIASGNLQLLWSNFTGNYMQIASMNVYRPCLLLTLLADCLIWQGNAFGYYLTNILFFAGDVALLYFLVRSLTRDWGYVRSGLVSLLSASLFAASPLHCESVSWIVGRVDAACCFFYLSSLLLLLKSRVAESGRSALLLTTAGIIAFLVSITIKEMAIGLPVMLTVIGLLFGRRRTEAAVGSGFPSHRTNGLLERMQESWQLSSPVWIATAGYFLVRYLALGTVLGGYTGSIGAGQSASAIARWLDLDTWHRLFFPLALDLFSTSNIYSSSYFWIYLALASILAVRVCAGVVPWRMLVFLGAWTATTLAPIYKLWGLGFNLEGARFCFFLSMVTSCALPILLFAPDRNNRLPGLTGRVELLSAACLCGLIAVSARVCYMTNLLWVHAGKEVKAVSEDARRIAGLLPPYRQVALLGLPKEHAGAHMILNGDTFRMLMAPPFIKKDVADAFLTFEPIVYGDSNLVNATRFKETAGYLLASAEPGEDAPKHDPKATITNESREAAKTSNAGATGLPGNILVWSSADKRFHPVPLWGRIKTDQHRQFAFGLMSAVPATTLPHVLGHARYERIPGGWKAVGVRQEDGLSLDGIKLNPLDWDVLEFKCRMKSEVPVRFAATWNSEDEPGKSNLAYSEVYEVNLLDGQEFQVRLPLSRYWRWYSQPAIKSLAILFPAASWLEMTELKLLPSRQVAPVMSANKSSSTTGVIFLDKPFELRVDASKIDHCAKIAIEYSARDFFFDSMTGEAPNEAISARDVVGDRTGTVKVAPGRFPSPGFYQIRARALDSSGTPLGLFSDPLTLRRSE